MKAIFGVDYEEFNPQTYKGCFVTIHEEGKPDGRFDSNIGDVTEDMKALHLKVNQEGVEEKDMFYASSVDNFAQDSAKRRN